MESEEIISEILEQFSDEISGTDFKSEFMDKLDTIIENQSDISDTLNTVTEGQASISYALYCILGLAILVIGFKIVWTVLAKWLFGGV